MEFHVFLSLWSEMRILGSSIASKTAAKVETRLGWKTERYGSPWFLTIESRR